MLERCDLETSLTHINIRFCCTYAHIDGTRAPVKITIYIPVGGVDGSPTSHRPFALAVADSFCPEGSTMPTSEVEAAVPHRIFLDVLCWITIDELKH